jgi:hypothetical protein
MYLIRERFFRLGEDSDITDDQGRPAFRVDGKVLSLHNRLIIRDPDGREVAQVHRKLATLRPTYRAGGLPLCSDAGGGVEAELLERERQLERRPAGPAEPVDRDLAGHRAHHHVVEADTSPASGRMEDAASEGSRPWRYRTSSPRRGTP